MLPAKINTVLIADTMPFFSMGLRLMLNQTEDFQVLGIVSTGQNAIDIATEFHPDYVILDVEIKQPSSWDVASEILEKSGCEHVVLMGEALDPLVIQKAVSIGIADVISKNCGHDELQECLLSILKRPKSDWNYKERKSTFGNQLSVAEKRILRHIAQNRTTKEIADILNNSPRTIENHRHQICKKLKLEGKNSLLTFALENKAAIELELVEEEVLIS